MEKDIVVYLPTVPDKTPEAPGVDEGSAIAAPPAPPNRSVLPAWLTNLAAALKHTLSPTTLQNRAQQLIQPTALMRKSQAILNPFKSVVIGSEMHALLKTPDLVGPALYFVLQAVFLVLHGNSSDISLLYEVVLTGCVVVYLLLGEMGGPSLPAIASSMGHCLLPVLILTALAHMLRLQGALAFLFGLIASVWATLAVTRHFGLQTNISDRYALVVYPCTLIYGIIAFIAIL